MAKVKIQGHASGTGILTVTAPNTSTDRTITLPDATGTLLNSDGSAASLTAIPAANITGTLPAISATNLTNIPAANITGTLPAISGANLTGIAGIPTGVIAMWSGAANAIPSGWVACDGNNSTPNLVDKFIKSTAAAGSTGGSATTASHTLATGEIPSHSHGIMSSYSGTHDVNSYPVVGGNRGGQVMQYTESTGGAGGHTHGQSEPVHFTLIFIMKT
jgi:hypothetical protein